MTRDIPPHLNAYPATTNTNDEIVQPPPSHYVTAFDWPTMPYVYVSYERPLPPRERVAVGPRADALRSGEGR